MTVSALLSQTWPVGRLSWHWDQRTPADTQQWQWCGQSVVTQTQSTDFVLIAHRLTTTDTATCTYLRPSLSFWCSVCCKKGSSGYIPQGQHRRSDEAGKVLHSYFWGHLLWFLRSKGNFSRCVRRLWQHWSAPHRSHWGCQLTGLSLYSKWVLFVLFSVWIQMSNL